MPAFNTHTMRLILFALITLLIPFASSTHAEAESPLVMNSHIKVGLVSELAEIAPDQPFWIALRLLPDDGWHTYWRNPGDTGLPTRIEWQLPDETQAGPIQWPLPERIDYLGLINYGYHGETLLLTQIQPPPNLQIGSDYTIKATAKYLVCADVCIPGEADVALTLPVADQAISSSWAEALAAQAQMLPQRQDLETAQFSVSDAFHFRLSTENLPLRDVRDIQFFPIDTELVHNASLPQLHQQAGELQISVAKDPYLERIPERFKLLVSVTGNGTTEGYEITAVHAGSTSTLPPQQRSMLSQQSVWSILLLAVAGGLILNLMPCVFPVLSIKVLSLIESSQLGATHQKLHGVAYTCGVVLSFLAIAALLLMIRAAGEGVGWGFQLQSPWFVATLVYLFFILGMGMAGYIEIGASLTRAGSLLGNGSGLSSSFGTGVLATIVATPCTAPFMGTAMGFAMTQSTAVALMVFAALGFGLAMPFLLLTLIPGLAKRMPRPGKWMETLKEFLAFPLFLTMVWLLWVLSRQTHSDTIALVLTGIVLLAFALWLWRNSQQQRHSPAKKSLASLAALGAIAILLTVEPGSEAVGKANAHLNAQPYSNELLAESIAAQRPVFVNFTADWCITCKVNERVALNSSDLKATFNELEVTYLVGDWTNGSATITEVLEQFGRNGVPLYLLYLPGHPEPRILPQILTPGLVINALKIPDR